MLEALPRRAVLGRLAALPLIGATGAIVAIEPAGAEHAATLARIEAAGRRCVDAKQAFEAALAAYAASFPKPHWSLAELCRRSVLTTFRYPGGPRFLPNESCIDDDYYDFWMANKTDREACHEARRLRRRLLRRLERHRQRVRAHVAHHQLDELRSARILINRDMHELAEEVFKRPVTTIADVLLQARALQAFGSSLDDQQDWYSYQACAFGRRLAGSLCELEHAA